MPIRDNKCGCNKSNNSTRARQVVTEQPATMAGRRTNFRHAVHEIDSRSPLTAITATPTAEERDVFCSDAHRVSPDELDNNSSEMQKRRAEQIIARAERWIEEEVERREQATDRKQRERREFGGDCTPKGSSDQWVLRSESLNLENGQDWCATPDMTPPLSEAEMAMLTSGGKTPKRRSGGMRRLIFLDTYPPSARGIMTGNFVGAQRQSQAARRNVNEKCSTGSLSTTSPLEIYAPPSLEDDVEDLGKDILPAMSPPTPTLKITGLSISQRALVASVYDAIVTAFITLKRVLTSTPRHQIQWWNEDTADDGPRSFIAWLDCYHIDAFATGHQLEDGFDWIVRLGEALWLAGARMTSTQFKNIKQNTFELVQDPGAPCTNVTPNCVLDEGLALITVCATWGLPPAPMSGVTAAEKHATDAAALIAALVSSDILDIVADPTVSGIRSGSAIGRWVWSRHQKHGYDRCTAFTDWDCRPEASRLNLLNYPDDTYIVQAKKNKLDQYVDLVGPAWWQAWVMAEDAWRFLYKMGLIYIRLMDNPGLDAQNPLGVPIANDVQAPSSAKSACQVQVSADPDAALEAMWLWGGQAFYEPDPDGVWFAGNRRNPEGHATCRPAEDVCMTRSNTLECSLRAFFGDYTRKKFLTVLWTMTAMVSRFQGDILNPPFMGDMLDKDRSAKFKVNRSGNASFSDPWGTIHLRKWWLDGSDFYRATNLFHEMFHYLVRTANGGRPRDVYDPKCTGGSNKCYEPADAQRLGIANDWEAMKNVDNYRGWAQEHHLRWCGDWPPIEDVSPHIAYYPDPITDETFWDHFLERTTLEAEDGEEFTGAWELVIELRDRWFGSDWKPHRDDGYLEKNPYP